MYKLFYWWFLAGLTVLTSSCATFPSDQEINNPNDGTVQGGDPSVYEHRE